MERLICREILRRSRPLRSAGVLHLCRDPSLTGPQSRCTRSFHISRSCRLVKPYLLADIGEGITECQIIDWLVKPGDYVHQFDPICEVQSDKASVEITSRFDGTIKALHYEVDDMAIVGKPILDIDIDDNVNDTEELCKDSNEKPEQTEAFSKDVIQQTMSLHSAPQYNDSMIPAWNLHAQKRDSLPQAALLLTPRVRRMLKELGMEGSEVRGTGKDGRITEEDVHRHNLASTSSTAPPSFNSPPNGIMHSIVEEDRPVALSQTERQMFKVMTESLTIPHFLYTHNVDITFLNSVRRDFNTSVTSSGSVSKLSLLPFIMKAVSNAFLQFPKLNSHLDTTTEPTKPRLLVKAAHNFGIAIDTPQGLLVPVVRNVQGQSIVSLAVDIARLGKLAKEGRLAPEDFRGATFTISNIGSIGGSAVAPVIVAPMLGILAVGRVEKIPVFKVDEHGVDTIVKGEQIVLSWSADHRVIDGATVAKVGKMVEQSMENAETFGMKLE